MKSLILICVVYLLFSILAPVTAVAQNDGDPVSIGTYHVIESKALGETRRLLVHLPRGYDGSNITYPVVYHTYGDYVEQYYTEAVKVVEELGNEARMPQMILVGIDNIDRYRDLRPIMRDGSPAGIENYTKFLVDEVFPFVEKNYRTAGYRIVIGPQAGAVFCLYTLQYHTDLFDAFILNNPLVHPQSNELLFDRADKFYQNQKSLNKYFFITYDDIDDSSEDISEIDRFAQLAATAADKGFDLRLNKLVDNDDFIPPAGLKEGLAGLFADYYHPMDQPFGSLDEINAFYGSLSGRYGFEVAPAEIVMTFSAVELMNGRSTEKAVEILEFQTTLYPGMVNAWWQLAGIAAGAGETEKAIELYRKCVEIDPAMKNFVDRRINALTGEED